MKRIHRLELMLSDAERAAVAAGAETTGLTMAAYARQAMMLDQQASARLRAHIVDRAAVAALNMLGSNLNQIARVANESKTMTADQIRALGSAYKKLQSIVRQIEAPTKAAAE